MDGASTCAGFGDLESPLAAGSVDTLNAGDPLHYARTARAPDVPVKGGGDAARHGIKHGCDRGREAGGHKERCLMRLAKGKQARAFKLILC